MSHTRRYHHFIHCFAFLGIFLLILSGCGGEADHNSHHDNGDNDGKMAPAAMATVSNAVAVMHATTDNSVSGIVTFSKVEGGVKVSAQISGLTPGDHGFHIHQYGDCSSGDGKSAAGHFNPENKAHAGPTSAERHIGDMGNITADADGNANHEYVDTVISLNGANSIIGRGVIIHAGTDDLTSQPTGAAGGRVACGVIGVAK